VNRLCTIARRCLHQPVVLAEPDFVGRLAVRRQAPEWTGAPQKRFAWAIGWGLAVTMLWLIVISGT
jgi:uncharacterized YccA/Bax inhibitor family protein